MAMRLGARFLVRMEDIDHTRARPQFVDAIFADLAWLGIAWEEPVLFQSAHLPDYKAAVDRLGELGLTYPCFATRTEVAVSADPERLDPDGGLLYPGLWRGRPWSDVADRVARGEPFAVRLDMARAVDVARRKLNGAELQFTELDANGGPQTVLCERQRWGDVILLRKETPSSYLVAVVVDDARQGITHVTRGRDLFASTSVQRLLQVLLDLPEPLYQHHRLITDASGSKLAKSNGAQPLSALREAGLTPRDVRRLVGLDGPLMQDLS